jgi:hypothetical protein
MSNDETEQQKGPGGLTIRQIHEQVKKSSERDRSTQKANNPLADQKNRWQRFTRHAWGKSGRK